MDSKKKRQTITYTHNRAADMEIQKNKEQQYENRYNIKSDEFFSE